MILPFRFRLLPLAWTAAAALAALPRLGADPMPVRVAVVVTFEVRSPTAQNHGEFFDWEQREPWTGRVQVPGVDHEVLIGPNGVIGVVAGTTVRASNQIMALVLSGRFDFSKTYWIINGIGGVDPAVASVGSAAWAPYVIDGDIAYEIDPREGEPWWPYGILAIGAHAPNQKPSPEGWEPDTMAFRLNPRLLQWAYDLTKNVALASTPKMAAFRARYKDYPEAQRPPFVFVGASFGCCRYWHGHILTQWARDWTKIWTDGRGTFAMADMEDQGFAAALSRLSKMDRVDFQRVLFLRTASNYCFQPPGEDAEASMLGGYDAYLPSLDAAYRVGSVVAHEISRNWARFQDNVP